MKTSNYARSGKLSNAICISVGPPRFLPNIKKDLRLAPERAWLHATPEKYDELMAAKLATMDPKLMYDSMVAMVNGGQVDGEGLVEPLLLCYESPGVKCHRRMVAEWFERELGIEVTELGFDRTKVPAYANMPLKAYQADGGKKIETKPFKAEKPLVVDTTPEVKDNSVNMRIFGEQQGLI